MRATGAKENTMWRSATGNQPISGYDKKVMQHVESTRGKPPVQRKEPQPNMAEAGISVDTKPAAAKISNNLSNAITQQN